MYAHVVNNDNNKNKDNKIVNGYSNEYKHDLSENYPLTVASLSIISYPIEPTLFMIICNAIRNIINLIIDIINEKIDGDKNNKEALSEMSTILYQQVRSNIPFGSDSEDPDYEDDEELGRAWCIYYAWDPSDTELVKVFRINGKTTDKNVEHEINMHKVDWNYEFKLGYYHANPCLVDYYRKSGKEELMNDFIGEND